MDRYVYLARELPRCRYFTEQERHMRATVDEGVTKIVEMSMPDAGSTRDMLAILRQLFSDKERGGFARIIGILRDHAAPETEQGRALLDALGRYERLKQGALDS